MPSDWERVAADPALLAAVRARYTGSGDVLDQVWWIEHPGTPTPGGTPDPLQDLEAARDALYRPGADAAAAARFARSSAAAAADRTAAATALQQADRVPPPPAPARRTGVGRTTVAGAVLAALLVGAAAGFIAARTTAAPSAPALSVFDRAQREEDRPPSTASLPRAIAPTTLRLIGSSTTTGVSVYAARRGAGTVCIVAVVLADEAVAACTSDAAFAVAGLSLTLRAAADPENDSGASPPRELTPSWSPDGRLTF